MELSGVQLIAIFIVSAIAGMGSVLDEQGRSVQGENPESGSGIHAVRRNLFHADGEISA